MKSKLEKLGYVVAGDLFNTADYGLPQQRRRAWILCIQASELATSAEQLIADMRLFARENVTLSECVDLEEPMPPDGHELPKDCQPDAKWKKGLEIQFEIYGKARDAGCVLIVSTSKGAS